MGARTSAWVSRSCVSSDCSTEIENVAVIAPGLTPQSEENIGPDRAVVTTPVTESADLQLAKSISSEIVAGSTGRYLLQVTNLGPSTGRGVTITDTLPAPLRFARPSG